MVWMCLATSVVCVAIVLWGWRGRVPRVPECPKCGYDCSAVPTGALRCPECGHSVRNGIEWRQRRRRPRIALIALLVACAAAWFPFRVPVARWVRMTFLPRWEIAAAGKAAGASVRIERDRWNDLPGEPQVGGPPRVIVESADGEARTVIPGFYLTVGPHRPDGSPLPPDDTPGFGGDVDGDGEADLVIELPSGGSGGATTTILYAFSREGIVPKVILENVWFEDEDRNGTFEAVGFDGTFAYVWTSGAGSTRPRIALRPSPERSGPWIIDAERMLRVGPSDEELTALAKSIADASPDNREAWLSPLLRGTIRLLYAGRSADAASFLRSHWRGTPESIGAFETEFKTTFEKSPYAAAIRRLSGDQQSWP